MTEMSDEQAAEMEQGDSFYERSTMYLTMLGRDANVQIPQPTADRMMAAGWIKWLAPRYEITDLGRKVAAADSARRAGMPVYKTPKPGAFSDAAQDRSEGLTLLRAMATVDGSFRLTNEQIVLLSGLGWIERDSEVEEELYTMSRAGLVALGREIVPTDAGADRSTPANFVEIQNMSQAAEKLEWVLYARVRLADLPEWLADNMPKIRDSSKRGWSWRMAMFVDLSAKPKRK